MTIQRRRLENGWSQEQLAVHTGLSTRTIQRIESGQSVGMESLKCLAAVFDTDIGTLKQEQTIAKQALTAQPMHPRINKIEGEAITFAQSIFGGPRKGEADPLSKIEREAIDYAKRLWKKLKT